MDQPVFIGLVIYCANRDVIGIVRRPKVNTGTIGRPYLTHSDQHARWEPDCQVWAQSTSAWPQMGQILDFSEQISVSQIVLKSDLKMSRICSIWDQSEPLRAQCRHPWEDKNINDSFQCWLSHLS